MVANGITRARLPADNEVDLHARRSARRRRSRARLGNTRSAAAMELWRERLAGALVAIGNAPTALFRLLEMLDAGAPQPGRGHRHAGRLRRRGRSRRRRWRATAACRSWSCTAARGGSAMAAAAVNALASAASDDDEHAAVDAPRSTASASAPATRTT